MKRTHTGEIRKKKQIFVIPPNVPLEFAIVKGKMLQFKFNRLVQRIRERGGIVKEYNDETKKTCIVLADEDDESFELEVDNTFTLAYIDDCFKNKKLLPIKEYRISTILREYGPSQSKSPPVFGDSCPDFDLLTKDVCKHCESTPKTLEEQLDVMEKFFKI